MREWKILAASFVFFALTVVKLLFPGPAAALREDVTAVISAHADYRGAMEALGRRLTASASMLGDITAGQGFFASGTPRPSADPPPETSPMPAPTPVPTPEPTSAPTSVPMPTPEPAPEPTPVPTLTPTPTPEPTPVPTPTPDGEPAVVAAFLESQAAFTELAIPANVRCDMPALPFAYAHPVAAARSSGFGYRVHPLTEELRFHYGTDLAAVTGEAISAFADGTVRFAGENDSYGKYLILEHAEGYSTLYAHCSALQAGTGEQVTAGEVIALVGATGQVTGPHLHFELRCGEQYLNPEYYLSAL